MSSTQAPVSISPTPVISQPQSLGKGSESGSAAPPAATSKKNYKGFVAGVFSGIAKLSGKLGYDASVFTIGNGLISANLLNLVGHPYV